MNEIGSILFSQIENAETSLKPDELSFNKEMPVDLEGIGKPTVEPPDVSYIESVSRNELLEQWSPKISESAAPQPDELSFNKEMPVDLEGIGKPTVEPPDVSYIESTSRNELLEQWSPKASENTAFKPDWQPSGERTSVDLDGLDKATVESPEDANIESAYSNKVLEQWPPKVDETRAAENLKTSDSSEGTEGLTDEEKAIIKKETGWSDEIIEHIKNMKQYEILKNARLIEAEINGRKCLIRENIDLDYTDKDGISNRERMARGLAPLDSKTGKPIELHHLGQKADSPLVELTEEEHRTGEFEEGKKNQSLWHDYSIETETHGEGNSWAQERKAHWKARAENYRG